MMAHKIVDITIDAGGPDPGDHKLTEPDQVLVPIIMVRPPPGSEIPVGQIDHVRLPPGYVLYKEE